MVVVALLGALRHGDDPARSASSHARPRRRSSTAGRTCPGRPARGGMSGTWSIQSPVREHVVGVDVVRLPERAPVGRDREAAELDLVADHPRRHHDHRDHRHGERRQPSRRARQSRKPREHERAAAISRAFERTASPRHRAERRGDPERCAATPRAASARTARRRSAGRGSRGCRAGRARRDRAGASRSPRRSARSRGDRNRRPISNTTSDVATATRSCAVPTDHQWKPPIQKTGIRNQP